MMQVGTPLKEWDISINYGIKTGYNAAFIVPSEVRDRLIAEDPASEDVLKPILRGRDIRPYRAQWAGLWLIATFPSLSIDVDQYPAIKRHLLSFGQRRLEQSGAIHADGTRSRKKSPHKWYELQDTCAYHEEFRKEKLLWMDMSPVGRFWHSESEMYGNDKTFLMTGKSGQYLKYLCAFLNSRLASWFVNKTGLTTGEGLVQWKKFTVESIPVPMPSPGSELVYGDYVDKATARTASATEALEQLVFDSYLLDDRERCHLQSVV